MKQQSCVGTTLIGQPDVDLSKSCRPPDSPMKRIHVEHSIDIAESAQLNTLLPTWQL